MLSEMSRFSANSRTAVASSCFPGEDPRGRVEITLRRGHGLPPRLGEERCRERRATSRLAPPIEDQVHGNFETAELLAEPDVLVASAVESGSMTSRSRSLSSRASPRAREPKRMTSASGAALESRRPASLIRPSSVTARLTGFEPVTFGFVARARRSAGLRGARFQAVSGESRPAGIGWNLWGMLPHLLPQGSQPRRYRAAASGIKTRVLPSAATRTTGSPSSAARLIS
jgi:hypothetical protein